MLIFPLLKWTGDWSWDFIVMKIYSAKNNYICLFFPPVKHQEYLICYPDKECKSPAAGVICLGNTCIEDVVEEKLQCFTVDPVIRFTWKRVAFLLEESKDMSNTGLSLLLVLSMMTLMLLSYPMLRADLKLWGKRQTRLQAVCGNLQISSQPFLVLRSSYSTKWLGEENWITLCSGLYEKQSNYFTDDIFLRFNTFWEGFCEKCISNCFTDNFLCLFWPSSATGFCWLCCSHCCSPAPGSCSVFLLSSARQKYQGTHRYSENLL